MKIKSITVSGFKNLRKTTIELSNITAIVSPNNYGKSNLLEAIDFGVDFISANERNRKVMMKWIKGIPINMALENEDFYFEIEFDSGSNDDYRYVRYGYSFSWYRDNGEGQKITNEWIDARSNESVKYTSFLKRKEGKYRKEKGTGSFRNINLDDAQLAIDFLISLEDISIQSVIKAIKNVSFHVCSSLDLKDRFKPNVIEYIEDDTMDNVSFDDNDVPRALFKLQKFYPDKYDLFLEAIYTLFPEFLEVSVQSYALNVNSTNINTMVISQERVKTGEDVHTDKIPFKIKDELYRVIIKSRYMNQAINIDRMSTGTKRIFWLLANVFIASSKNMSFIGVEELETSIHPKLLKNLLEFLDEVLENTSIIISSHSPFLVQYIKPNKIYIGKPCSDGTAVFKTIKQNRLKSLISLARENGMTVGEYIFELMSGDIDNETILSFYLEG
ncbi:MAG: AAA family ATPase [Firmicutes bacterium]|nr:AAA family ATPase [Bacillota bacterium]